MSRTNDYAETATTYAKHKVEGTLKLAYEQFGGIFSKYATEGRKAIDFGCGAGRSTRYLQELGFTALGVDIDPAMLATAATEASKESLPPAKYSMIEGGVIQNRPSEYDVAFSTMVLLEMPSLEEMQKAFAEVYRVLKFNGVFISLVVTDDFYSRDWVSVDCTSYPENRTPKSGDKIRIKIREIGLELSDYYWTRDDYRRMAQAGGFAVVEEVVPTFREGDPDYEAGKTNSPYLILIMKKQFVLENIETIAARRGLINIERGFFKEIFRSETIIPKAELPPQFSGERNTEATIELLMNAGQKWPFHRLISTETIRHIEGRDMTFHLIDGITGEYRKVLVGVEDDSAVQEFVIPPGTWYAEEVEGKAGYSLITATTRPGFHPHDSKEATQEELLMLVGDNPKAREVVSSFFLTVDEEDCRMRPGK